MTHDLEKRMILARFHYLRNAVNALDCLKLTVDISLYRRSDVNCYWNYAGTIWTWV